MKFLRILHSGYSLAVFTIVFLILFPFFLIFLQKESWHKYAIKLNQLWAKFFFTLSLIPVEIEYQQRPEKQRRYVFCANHTSYLDIPIVGLNGHNFVFVGKSSMGKIPLFGYMYKKLHITLDRSSLKSKYDSLLKAKEAIDNGKSVLMFPEGGILTTNPPHMAPFKDGPFRLAIEKQIPLVPITIPFNWIILPDGEKLIRRRKAKIIYHAPIDTTGLTLNDLDALKEKTFLTIQRELEKQVSRNESR